MGLFWRRRQTGRIPTRLVVGLGNPGLEYEQTRHNLGFQTVDMVAHDLGVAITRRKGKALIGETQLGDCRVVLVKPQTFMNLSGLAVAPLLSRYQVAVEDVLVICDDLDLAVGQIRLRRQGGPGGHNGLKSIIASLGTENFPRLRIGIGRPPGEWDAVDYVLQPLQGEARQVLLDSAQKAAAAVRCYLTDGLEAAMNRYNN